MQKKPSLIRKQSSSGVVSPTLARRKMFANRNASTTIGRSFINETPILAKKRSSPLGRPMTGHTSLMVDDNRNEQMDLRNFDVEGGLETGGILSQESPTKKLRDNTDCIGLV